MAPTRRTTRSSPGIKTTTTTPVTNAQLKALIDQGVADGLAARDIDRSQNGKNIHDSRTGVRRQARLAHECTYPDFMKFKPLYFKGIEGVVKLTWWFERIETMLCISNFTVENQIMFATCTLLGSTLTWWNSNIKTVGHDLAYAMAWTNLKKNMTDKYCPRGEIMNLEVEMWNLKVKGTNVVSYNQRFQDLALMCARMFPKESDKIERYVAGLPDMIHKSVMASKPKTMHDAAYAAGPEEKKPCEGSKPLCSKCNYHHRNLTCYECASHGHYLSDCPELKNQNHGNQATGTGARRMVHALGGGEANKDLNNMEDDIIA
nr:hypothetical protein [Tanacetum cinerariifolium]